MKNSNGSKTKLKESSNDTEISARQRAEAQAEKIPLDVSEMPAEKIEEVVQELNVHQIQLATQNESLQRISKELEKSRDDYRELFDFAPVGYFTLAPDYRILEVNLTGCTMLGLSRQDLLNDVFTRYLLPAYTDTFYLCLQNAEKSKALIACEYQMHKSSGSVFAVSARIGWTPEVGGQRQCRLAIMDVTEQKKAETALKESEQRFRELADALSEGIYETDTSGALTYTNRRMLALLGSSEEEVKKGLSLFDIFSPAYVVTARSSFARVLRGEDAGANEYLIKRRDGTQFPALVHSLAIKNAEVQGVRGILVDITAHKKAEQALKESEERFFKTFQSSPLAMTIASLPDGRWTEVNDSFLRMTEYNREEIVGHTSVELGMFPNAEQRAAGIQDFLETGKMINREFSVRTKTGKLISVLSSSEQITIGGKTYAISISVDITERKKAEVKLKEYSVKLEEANAQLQQFVYAASHDLREPLRMMTSFSQSLAKYLEDKLDARAREYVEFVVNGAARMQRLLDDLLIFSRVATQTLPFQQVDMERVFQDVLVNLKVSIEETGATITHDKLPEIEADPAQMAQVLQNLISNAIKFHCQGEQPVVRVSYKKDSEWIFYVKDNGIGISQELFGRLFVIFSRLNPQEEYPGSGMGLAITKRVVQRHGGRVWVESEPGKGSTFYFTVAINNTEKETGSQEQVLS